MSKFTTFYEWLEKQKGKKSPLGKLANDAVRDESFPKDVASLDALLAYIHQQSMLEAVRQAVREEVQPIVEQAGLTKRCT